MTFRVGLAGLGAAARQILPAFKRTHDVELAAVADTRSEALDEFKARGVQTFDSVEGLARSNAVDAIWIATPNANHMEHAILAAQHGKHLICEKPMALNLEQAQAMVDAVDANHVVYVQGHSKIYNPPVRKMREIVVGGELGRVYQINSWNYRNWLNQPRLPSEVDTATGGGVVYRQGPHQMDVVRCIGGGMVKSVRGSVGRWNPNFNTEGNFCAFLEFEDGTTATTSLQGYDFFDVTELTWGIGEGGQQTPIERLYDSHVQDQRLTAAFEPAAKYALPEYTESHMEERQNRRQFQPFYGLTIVSCERGDIRQSPEGIFVYTEKGRTEVPCGEERGHASELTELYEAVTQQRPSFPDARWGMATLEVLLTIMQSAKEHREIELKHQVPVPAAAIPAAV
ncbi:MAG: phthalate 4,5-cis-dihydrodiol dehydrogenase [Chloroflexota bacterium]|nr:phthalate 4,5-cis-dihydrodiol dehydrogenase [Chloroflexota bacterium]